MLISIILIVISIWNGESVYSIIGFIFIFFLSVFIFMPGNITYQTSSTLNLTYTSSTVSGSITDTYTNFDDSTSKWFGRWLAIISAVGLVMSLIEGSKAIRRKDDD
jgi:hypothetical protein